ncbi:MAG: YkgJ family cysteine cluster protein [Deltaproteobacteria bacterium]|nr:YkgJ family cysteine cluster protein [Deltaproteobacteria bacterium]MBW2283556.1 YkgJ family cysteine cluster protein [Deltaproteobacteria bacterium]
MKAFDCQLCGQCCYGEGGIYVTPEEIDRIAEFLGRTPAGFLSESCEDRNSRTYLRTGADNYCFFFDKEKMCLIHPVKPARCIRWPYFNAIVADRDNWELAKEACPGINPDCTHEQFVREAEAAGFPAEKKGAESV